MKEKGRDCIDGGGERKGGVLTEEREERKVCRGATLAKQTWRRRRIRVLDGFEEEKMEIDGGGGEVLGAGVYVGDNGSVCCMRD